MELSRYFMTASRRQLLGRRQRRLGAAHSAGKSSTMERQYLLAVKELQMLTLSELDRQQSPQSRYRRKPIIQK